MSNPNFDWLRESHPEYAGKWVALLNGTPVDSDVSRYSLHNRISQREDVRQLLLYRMSDADVTPPGTILTSNLTQLHKSELGKMLDALANDPGQKAWEVLSASLTQVAIDAQEVVNQATNHHNIVYTVDAGVVQQLIQSLKTWKDATEEYLATQVEQEATSDTKEL